MLTNAIKEVEKEVKNAIPAINYGGCAYLAYFLAERLMSIGEYDFQFILNGPKWDKNGFKTCRHMWISLRKDDGISVSWVDFNKGSTAKGERVISVDSYIFIKTLKDAISWRNRSNWSSLYERKNNRIIKAIIKKRIKQCIQ